MKDAELITTASYKLIEKSLFFCRFLRFHPLRWNKQTKTLEVSQSTATMVAWGLGMILTFGYYGFLVTRTVQVMMDGSSMKRSIYMAFMTAFFTFPVLFHIHFVATWGRYDKFVNHYLEFFQYCTGEWFPLWRTFCIEKNKLNVIFIP